MQRIQIEATVQGKKESAVRPGVFYITAAAPGWGEVKFVSTRKGIKEGDKVSLVSQKLRASFDRIVWEERK